MAMVYDVESVRDGGSFSSRRVVARQGGQVIFYLSASFHQPEEGFDHRDPVPEGVPGPEDCPRLSEVMARASGRASSVWEREWGALDVRYVGDTRRGGLPVDPRLLAYASDLTLLSASMVPHGLMIGVNVQAASIDHAMWFHRPFRADQWLLYDQISPSASAGLGLSTARLFQEDVLVSDVAQEGLIRPIKGSGPDAA
jgi:acyl-CoA thioesterase-2